MRELHQEDPEVSVWWETRVECTSALRRRLREQPVEPEIQVRLQRRLMRLFEAVQEVEPTEDIRVRAERLLNAHSLRAADALQLASALRWASERPVGVELVCL